MTNSTSQSNENESPTEPDTAAEEAKKTEFLEKFDWMVSHLMSCHSLQLQLIVKFGFTDTAVRSIQGRIQRMQKSSGTFSTIFRVRRDSGLWSMA